MLLDFNWQYDIDLVSLYCAVQRINLTSNCTACMHNRKWYK